MGAVPRFAQKAAAEEGHSLQAVLRGACYNSLPPFLWLVEGCPCGSLTAGGLGQAPLLCMCLRTKGACLQIGESKCGLVSLFLYVAALNMNRVLFEKVVFVEPCTKTQTFCFRKVALDTAKRRSSLERIGTPLLETVPMPCSWQRAKVRILPF